jgi:protein-L-isoaspartate(D-aspartate) O-methyltransferase
MTDNICRGEYIMSAIGHNYARGQCLRIGFFLFLFCVNNSLTVAADADIKRVEQREALIREIEQDVKQTSIYIGKERFDPKVMQAMATVPRHEFVPDSQRRYAYENRPLPIGYGQTISQPYIVALMTDLLEVKSGDRILEIGTGSGYQAAVLIELTQQVYTIEIVQPLGERARETFKRLGLDNIQTRVGDGYFGWEAHAPYDGIVVTAAAGHVPPPLVKQLKPGGRMVIPVGSRFFVQQLVLVLKDNKGEVTTRQILPVRFVPLTGGH